jgi:hypothetical protein
MMAPEEALLLIHLKSEKWENKQDIKIDLSEMMGEAGTFDAGVPSERGSVARLAGENNDLALTLQPLGSVVPVITEHTC